MELNIPNGLRDRLETYELDISQLITEFNNSIHARTIRHIDPFRAGIARPGKFSPKYASRFRTVIDRKRATYIYYKPRMDYLAKYLYPDHNSYNDIYRTLDANGTNMGLYRFTSGGEDHFLAVAQGLIMDLKGRILYLMATKSYVATTNPDDFRVYIASELYEDETYKYFIKKFDSEYLSIGRKQGVEIITRSSLAIEQEMFDANVVQKMDSADNFAMVKEGLREKMVQMLMDRRYDVYRGQMTSIRGTDHIFPSPVKNGFTYRNLKTLSTDDLDRKILYYILSAEMRTTEHFLGSTGNFGGLLDWIHSNYNPPNNHPFEGLKYYYNNGQEMMQLDDVVDGLHTISYRPVEHMIEYWFGDESRRFKLKCSPFDELSAMESEFGPIENLTFVTEYVAEGGPPNSDYLDSDEEEPDEEFGYEEDSEEDGGYVDMQTGQVTNIPLDTGTTTPDWLDEDNFTSDDHDPSAAS